MVSYLDEFLIWNNYSGELTGNLANKINYYFGVPMNLLKEGPLKKQDLKKIILNNHQVSELEKNLESETESLLNGNF